MGHKVHLCDKGGVIGVYKQNPCAHLEFTPDKQFWLWELIKYFYRGLIESNILSAVDFRPEKVGEDS
jgi:hypothetical protein